MGKSGIIGNDPEKGAGIKKYFHVFPLKAADISSGNGSKKSRVTSKSPFAGPIGRSCNGRDRIGLIVLYHLNGGLAPQWQQGIGYAASENRCRIPERHAFCQRYEGIF